MTTTSKATPSPRRISSRRGRLALALRRLFPAAFLARSAFIAALAMAFAATLPAVAATRTFENGRWYNRCGTGSIWWEPGSAEGSINADGKLALGCGIGYTGTTVKRKFEFWLNYGLVGDTVTNTVKILASKAVAPSRASSTEYVFHGDWVAAGDVEYIDKGPFEIPGFDFSQDVWFNITFSNTLYNGSAPAAANDLTTYTEDYFLRQTYFGDFGATWSNDPLEFYVSGWAAAGYNFARARLTYALNGDELDASSPTMTMNLDANGAFLFTVPHASVFDVMTWKVEIIKTDGTAVTYVDKVSGESVFTTAHQDPDPADAGVYVTYTWTGAGGDGCWTNPANWASDYALCRGYPGTRAGGRVYASTTRFGAAAAGAVIDLGDGSYAGGGGGSSRDALVIDPGIGEFTLRNGTFGLMKNSGVNYIGASGTTLVLDNVDIVYQPGSAATLQIGFAANSTTVFEGNTTLTKWRYSPNAAQAGTTMIVRNGTLTMNESLTPVSVGQHTVLISNAVWKVNGNAASPVAATTFFRDGADRQAQFIATGQVRLGGLYDIAVPRTGHARPSIQAAEHSATTTDATAFSLDVTAWKKGGRLPLVTFTGSSDQSQKMAAKLESTFLGAFSDDRDVTAVRNAELVWSAADKTLYGVQDNVAKTGLFLR